MKELMKSKTFWAGVASVFSGAAMILSGNNDAGMQLVATGLIAIFLRNGINKKASK